VPLGTLLGAGRPGTTRTGLREAVTWPGRGLALIERRLTSSPLQHKDSQRSNSLRTLFRNS